MTAFLFTMPLSVWTTLDQIRAAVISGKLGAVMSISAILAAMMAAAVILKISSDYIQGQGVGIWQLVRPLVLLALVCQFNTLVLSPLNSLVNLFTRDLAATVNISTKEYISQWSSNMTYVEAYNLKSIDDKQTATLEELEKSSRSGIGKFFTKIWEGLTKFCRDLLSVTSFTVEAIVSAALFFIVTMLLFAQQILCALYLTIAGLIGPLVFALAIVSGYAQGIKAWIARYIQIAMWVPIGYIIMYINLQIGNVFMRNVVDAGGASLSTGWFMVVLQVVALVSVASVPKIAAWVIESTGANDAHGSVSQPMRTVARKLIKF